ncbi:hypothetical protein QX201_000012 [Fusarium graminearum]
MSVRCNIDLAPNPLPNLHSEVSRNTTVQISTRVINNVFLVDFGNGEIISLAAPWTVPVNHADLDIVIPKLKAALGTRRHIISITRSKVDRAPR